MIERLRNASSMHPVRTLAGRGWVALGGCVGFLGVQRFLLLSLITYAMNASPIRLTCVCMCLCVVNENEWSFMWLLMFRNVLEMTMMIRVNHWYDLIREVDCFS